MRKLFLLTFAAFLQPALAAPPKVVYLDRPGALEALAAENPEHHRQAVQILRVAETLPCKPKTKATEVTFDHARFPCEATLLMTSFPPKRRVSFTLDQTQYHSVVTVTDLRVRLMPAK